MPIKECLWLVKNGVPFDTAFALDDITRAAFSIVFAEFEGQEFDRKTFRYKDKG